MAAYAAALAGLPEISHRDRREPHPAGHRQRAASSRTTGPMHWLNRLAPDTRTDAARDHRALPRAARDKSRRLASARSHPATCSVRSSSRRRNDTGSRPSATCCARPSRPCARTIRPQASPRSSCARARGITRWTDDEIAQYRAHWPLGTQQRLVIEFALETASRRSEVVRLGPQHLRDGRIRIERTHGCADVDIPMSRRPASRLRRDAESASDLHRHRRRQAALEVRTRQRLRASGRRRRACRRAVGCTASRRAVCVAWPRMAPQRMI